jgi:nucleotide-binding universal stress UspA family protein
MKEKVVLSPVDFSEVSEFAIDHSIHIAKRNNAKLILLHIIKEASEMQKAQQKLQVHVDELKINYPDVDIQGIIRIGDIYTDIVDAAVENNARIIVMGTHGLKGFQFITGSRALKVVGDSEIPFLIVQKDSPKFNGYKSIMVPLSLEKDSKQKLSYVKTIAQNFGSKVYITVPKENDEFLKNKLTRDLAYSKQFFKESGIEYEGHQLDKKNEVDAYLDFIKNYPIDAIVLMNHNDSIFPLFNNEVQEMITNKERIPVLLINPKMTSVMSNFFNTMGEQ